MEPQTNDLKTIRILFFALLAGQGIFALLVTVLVELGILGSGATELTTILLVAVLVIAAGTIPASFILFRKRLADINPVEELSKKIEKYRAALILRMALCQMPTLFAVLSFFITHNRSFLWMIIVLISNFLYIYPSGNKIIQQLQLNSSEQSALGLN